VEDNALAYANSTRLVAIFAVVSIVLALGLGYGFSSSVIRPLRAMEQRMTEIAAGNFTNPVQVDNRDELGALAAELNSMGERLGSLYQELEATSQHKSDFLANMSHELRTPLNAVIGFSEVLQQKMFGDLNDKQVEYVEDIHSSGRHLLSLINDILDLSKIEAGKVELDRSRFDLPSTIEGTLTLVRERATRHGLTMDLALDEALGEIEADERKVRQILLNLLSNAVKFTADGGRIEITGCVVDDAAQISVSDTGIGIAPEDQAKIFEEFQQVGGDHEGKREGTGLGLTLARKFVELHGGRIWVDSVVGQGATFTFTLPLTSRAREPAPGVDAAEATVEDSEKWAAN
ncbi:MAG: HAMP domain-containing histidine kinase, partial [Betaproteobacteria bacterium]